MADRGHGTYIFISPDEKNSYRAIIFTFNFHFRSQGTIKNDNHVIYVNLAFKPKKRSNSAVAAKEFVSSNVYALYEVLFGEIPTVAHRGHGTYILYRPIKKTVIAR